MSVEHLAGIERVVASILQPDREVIFIVAILDKDWESALQSSATCTKLGDLKPREQITVWWVQVRNIGIMSKLSGEDAGPRRAADSCSTEVTLVKGPLVNELLFDQWGVF